MDNLQTGRRTLTIPEVAEALGLARSTAYEMAANDRLPIPVIRIGRRMMVSRELLERLLAGESIRGPTTEGVEAA